MAGTDGNWLGATHGNSYFSISIDPGVHHLCVTTEFGGLNGGEATAVAHFSAEAGGVYYFEANTIAWRDSQTNDVSLVPLDSDEGKYLAMSFKPVTSRVKK